MSGAGWSELLEELARHFESGLQLQTVRTGYDSYHPAERVQVNVSLANKRDHAASVEIHFSVKGPDDEAFRELSVVRRVPDAGDRTEVTTSFHAGKEPGLWTLRVEAWQDLKNAEQPGLEGDPAPLDRHDIGFVVVGHGLQSKTIISTAGPEILIDGKHGFWTGTNYYPSSSWWEWLWRDFRPLEAAQDFASMRRTGYRIVRIWVDPTLDEESLRAMDAAIYLASQQGIVLDICVFTQWVRDLEFERPDGRRIRFEYRDPRDFNVYGISLRQIALQQEYAATLARRWKLAGNVIYDLANETYVKDPDQSQIDPELLRRHPIPSQPGTRRDTLLFRAWASEMQAAMRAAGATQIIMPGYLFSGLDGGDNYLGNRDAPIEPWHSYAPFQATVATLAYQDPACSRRPMLLEEFGHAGWNPVRHYDSNGARRPCCRGGRSHVVRVGCAMAGAGALVPIPATARRAACTRRSALLCASAGAGEGLAREIDGNSSVAKWVHLRIDLYRYPFSRFGCDYSWSPEPYGRRDGAIGRATEHLRGDPVRAGLHEGCHGEDEQGHRAAKC